MAIIWMRFGIFHIFSTFSVKISQLQVVEFSQVFFDDQNMRNCLNKIFARCSRIERFEISECLCEKLQIFKLSLSNVYVNKLTIINPKRFDLPFA